MKPILALFIMLMLLFTVGCGQNITSRQDANQEQEANSEEEKDMFPKRAAVETEKPPIDRLVPEKLETATFALG